MGSSTRKSGILTWILLLCTLLLLQGCISPSNEVIEGLGTPDIVSCSSLPNVEDGALYVPRDAVELGVDGRKHPDIFYLGWSKLDTRADLRFPEQGYDADGYEDKLLVSRKLADGTTRTWQLLPQLDNNCKDVEKSVSTVSMLLRMDAVSTFRWRVPRLVAVGVKPILVFTVMT